ncbi:MAG: LysM domain-containing protein [Rhodoglobus sp.]
MATGTIASEDGKTSGAVRVTLAADGTYGFDLTDFATKRTGDVELLLNPVALGPAETCLDTGFRVTLGRLSADATQDFHLGDMVDIAGGDPTFLDEVVLTQVIPADVENDCAATVVAAAPLTWTLPDRRPDLTVVDSGPADGANGTVALDGTTPLTYTVADGDTLELIAERFGITTDDVFYLNPTRIPNPKDPIAHTGEIFNLSKAHR